MTLPRPVLLAVLGLALCAAAFLATRSANDTGSAVTAAPPAPAQKATQKPAQQEKADKAKAKANKPGADAAAKPQPQAPAKPKPSAPNSDVEKTLPAIKALARGDVVVFFFTRPGPADDTGADQAVKSISRQKGVSVFKAGFDDLETYRPVLSGAGVSQFPAIVIVRAGQDARLIEGYVDATTLRQNVADARR